jgi:glycosyltransferase involved in cell wall biosynthesis
MSKSFLVSVLITSYNRENFIAESISSVLNQTYENFELIIVDDCSSDNTYEIIKSYCEIDSRIQCFRNEKNIGQFQNRNLAASYAKGKYIKYLDSDDILYPHGLDVMVRGMEAFPSAALGMVWGDLIYDPSPKLLSQHDAYYSYYIHHRWMQVGPSGSIYRRDAFEHVNGFDHTPFISDFDLNLKLASLWPVVRLQTDLFFYRSHSNQQLSLGQNTNGYEVLNFKIQKRHLNSTICPLLPKEKEIALKMIEKLQARRSLKKLVFNMSFKDFKFLVIESDLGWKGFFRGIFTFK